MVNCLIKVTHFAFLLVVKQNLGNLLEGGEGIDQSQQGD